MPSQRSDLIQMDILFSRHWLVFLISSQVIFSDHFLDSRIYHILIIQKTRGLHPFGHLRLDGIFRAQTPTFGHLLGDSIDVTFSLYP